MNCLRNKGAYNKNNLIKIKIFWLYLQNILIEKKLENKQNFCIN